MAWRVRLVTVFVYLTSSLEQPPVQRPKLHFFNMRVPFGWCGLSLGKKGRRFSLPFVHLPLATSTQHPAPSTQHRELTKGPNEYRPSIRAAVHTGDRRRNQSTIDKWQQAMACGGTRRFSGISASTSLVSLSSVTAIPPVIVPTGVESTVIWLCHLAAKVIFSNLDYKNIMSS
jgi:hypothetical protein